MLAEIEEPKQNNDSIAKPPIRSTSQHQEMRSASTTDESNNISGVPRSKGNGSLGAGNIRRVSVMVQQHSHQQHQQQLVFDLDTIETDSLQPLPNQQPGDGGEIEANALQGQQKNQTNNRKNKCTACISFPNAVQFSSQQFGYNAF